MAANLQGQARAWAHLQPAARPFILRPSLVEEPPTVISCVEQTKYNPVPEVSTSDHKPIVAHFTITCAMPPERPSLGAVHGGHYRVQIKRLQLTNILAADLGGTSDPYLCFYTSPRGVLEVPGVRTNVKWKVPGIGATGGAVLVSGSRT